jgi:hypothetical protein
MDERQRNFAQGVALACAELVRNHDQPMMAYEILVPCGLGTLTSLKNARVDEYDAKVLRQVIKSERPRRHFRRPRVSSS